MNANFKLDVLFIIWKFCWCNIQIAIIVSGIVHAILQTVHTFNIFTLALIIYSGKFVHYIIPFHSAVRMSKVRKVSCYITLYPQVCSKSLTLYSLADS